MKKRTFKRIASGIAALAMVATLALPMTMSSMVASAGTVKITEQNGNDTDVHKYTVYQIFAGEVATPEGAGATGSAFNGNQGTLTKVKWAEGVVKDDVVKALKDSENPVFGDTFKSITDDAASVATAIATLSTPEELQALTDILANLAINNKLKVAVAEGDDIAKNGVTINDDGYYIIVETSLAKGEGADDKELAGTRTVYLLGVYDADAEGTLEIEAKSALPSFNKEILDTDDSGIESGTYNSEWHTSADHDRGDDVRFRLTATLPSDYANYTEYTLIFNDSLLDSKTGKQVFNLNAGSIVVYLDNGDGFYKVGDDQAFIPTTDYTVDSAAAATTGVFSITMADLKNSSLKGQLTANTKIYVEYTATLTADAVMGTEGNWNEAYLKYSNNPNYRGSGTPGEGPKSETPKNKVVTYIYQVHVDKVNDSGEALPNAGFTLYKKYSGQDAVPENLKDKIKTKTDVSSLPDGTWVEVEVKTASAATSFDFEGLDAGEYILVESTVPDGYTGIEPLQFQIVATHTDLGADSNLTELVVKDMEGNTISSTTAEDLTNGDAKFLSELDDGKLSTKITNSSSVTLPSTGGIGTTLFYLIGGTLVVGAGVTLITKKRMQKNG